MTWMRYKFMLSRLRAFTLVGLIALLILPAGNRLISSRLYDLAYTDALIAGPDKKPERPHGVDCHAIKMVKPLSRVNERSRRHTSSRASVEPAVTAYDIYVTGSNSYAPPPVQHFLSGNYPKTTTRAPPRLQLLPV